MCENKETRDNGPEDSCSLVWHCASFDVVAVCVVLVAGFGLELVVGCDIGNKVENAASEDQDKRDNAKDSDSIQAEEEDLRKCQYL